MKKLYIRGRIFYWRVRRYFQDHKVVFRPKFEKYRDQFYQRLWKETSQKMGAGIEDFGYGYYKININSHATYVRESKVQLDDHLSLNMAGNKPLVHRMLTEHRYPVQDFVEYSIDDLSRAWKFMQARNKPCVVKPAAATGAGNGITTKIHTYRELRKASLWAATFNTRLLIEEEIPGDSFRLLYLDGEYIDAVKRNPPQVQGDGKLAIKQLIQQENQARLKGDPVLALHPLVIDYECKLNLADQGHSLNYVPGNGERVSVKTVVNQNRISENESVRDIVHPSIIKAGSEIARLFNLKLVGVDLITTDVTQPLEAVKGVINEINTNPGLHHHYLINDKSKIAPVAQSILEYILKQ